MKPYWPIAGGLTLWLLGWMGAVVVAGSLWREDVISPPLPQTFALDSTPLLFSLHTSPLLLESLVLLSTPPPSMSKGGKGKGRQKLPPKTQGEDFVPREGEDLLFPGQGGRPQQPPRRHRGRTSSSSSPSPSGHHASLKNAPNEPWHSTKRDLPSPPLPYYCYRWGCKGSVG